ncbi:MAG: DUF819 family protein [Deltaproteobacteria bacterium]|uniref:DUF819 family protein n=1 Tax=Candidatus Zymogenus saltonus TaxID=2844893 RepID=A0A9D8KCE4_9DELT|nr:DUF819 family protein [Candidatus Zymogenus saltonus]
MENPLHLTHLILLSLFYIFFPAFLIYFAQRYPIIDKIGTAIICYGMGMAMSLIWAVPENAGGVQEIFMTITVPLAIPLMLFSMDIRKWLRLAPRTLISLILMVFSVLAVTTIGFMIFRDSIQGGEAWKVAGMLVGVYTGGTPNLSAIGLGLKASEEVIVLTSTADMLACTPWFFFILLFGQRFMNLFLPKFEKSGAKMDASGGDMKAEDIPESSDFSDYRGIFTNKIVRPLSLMLLLSVGIFAVGGVLYSILPKEYNMAVLMLTITTLGIAASFLKRVRDTKMTFQMGQYFILIFCLVVGSMADINKLFTAAMDIVLYTCLAVYGSWIMHMLLSAIFRIDTDTTIITATSALFSPPFVPVVASALKNKEVIISGLTTGIIGYAIGNYLGILLSPLLLKIP